MALEVGGSSPLGHPENETAVGRLVVCMDKEHIVTKPREAGPFERILTVTIAGDALAKAENKAARKLSHEVKIKGFRPGKAPRSLVEKVVGAESLRQEAVDTALPEAVAGAIRESDLKPVVAPRVEDIREIEEGVEVDVRITLWPEIDTLPDYEGREIEIERPHISDDDVDKQVERMRDQFAELEDVDREAFDGDYVLIDISRVDGDDIAKDMMYEVGSGTFIDGLDIPLRGSKAGSIEEFDTSLPQPEAEPEEAVAKVLIKQVKAKRLPELTDEWVSDVSEFETVAEMRERLTEDLAEMRVGGARMVLGERLMDALLADLALEMPVALVDAEIEGVLHRFANRLSQQGISIEQYLQLTGQDQDAFVDDLRSQASLNLRSRILLDGVAEAEGIEVSSDDIDQAIIQLAAASRTTVEEYHKALQEGGQEQTLAGDILREKAKERLVELAVPVDEDGDVIDLPAPDRADAPEGEGSGGAEDGDELEPADEEDEE